MGSSSRSTCFSGKRKNTATAAANRMTNTTVDRGNAFASIVAHALPTALPAVTPNAMTARPSATTSTADAFDWYTM